MSTVDTWTKAELGMGKEKGMAYSQKAPPPTLHTHQTDKHHQVNR